MWFAALYIFFVVVCVQAAALFVDKAVPYWPIEVSRMAASGRCALASFRIGALAMAVPITLDRAWSGPVAVLYTALVIIALVDDVWSPAGHMAGVALLGAASVWQTYLRGFDAVPIFAAAGVVFCARLVAKAATVWWCEMSGTDKKQRPQLMRLSTWQEIATHALQLMFGKRQFHSQWTKLAFRAGGVLQWTVFGILSLLFVERTSQ